MSVHDEQLDAQYCDPGMPPNVLPCEDALLGAVLLHGIGCARHLVPEDFYSEWNRTLFTVIRSLYERHPDKPYIDPIGVKDELFRLGRPHDATPMFLLYDDAINRWADPAYHAERILEAAEARIAQQYGQRLAQVGSSRPDAVTEVIEEMRTAIRDVRSRAGLDEMLDATRLDELVRLNRLHAATQAVPAASTGLVDLDRVLNGGLRPATFNVLGARPGVGKSLLAGSIAVHMGSTLAHRVLYMTLELTAAEVTNRMLANIANIELTRLQNPENLSDDDWWRYDHAQEQIREWPIHIEEGAKSIGEVESVARAYLSNVPAGLLVVDYLGRIREDGTAASRERHVALCASRLTDLAHELRVPVLCVVSFSRDSVKRGGPPRMDDIRDSGNVESDADTVMLMWQPPDDNDPTAVELIVDKNRYGATDTITLRKQGHRGRLVSAERNEWRDAA